MNNTVVSLHSVSTFASIPSVTIMGTDIPAWTIAVAVLLFAAAATLLICLLRKPSRVKKPVAPSHTAAPVTTKLFSLQASNASNIGKRDSQQDAFGISDIFNEAQLHSKGAVAIVADGMGGLENGADISALVTRTMLASFARLPGEMEPSLRLLAMVEDANAAVNEYLTGKHGSGSTVVATLVYHNDLYTISVGDSRICLVRNGAIVQLTRAHTFGVELDEKAARGVISYEEAWQDKQRHALTSYIGMGTLAKIDHSTSPIRLQSGDKVLLMSDGVFNTLSNEELLQAVAGDAAAAATNVERAVLEKEDPHQDNFTIVILQVN